MCLISVSRQLDEPEQKRFYKIMKAIRRKGQPTCYRFLERSNCRPLEKGVVRHAKSGRITIYSRCTAYYDYSYRAGFHGYVNFGSACSAYRQISRHRSVVIVLCTGLVHTVGYQQGEVYVVSTMKILREIKPK